MRIGVRLPQYASDWHTLRATAQALPPHMAWGARITGRDWVDGGWTAW